MCHAEEVYRSTDFGRAGGGLGGGREVNGTSRKVRRARTLPKADADGPDWTDAEIAEAFSCRTRTVERLRQRLCEQGFEATLNRAERLQPAVAKLLDGGQEARLVAMRLGPPPKPVESNPAKTSPAGEVLAPAAVEPTPGTTVPSTLKEGAATEGTRKRQDNFPFKSEGEKVQLKSHIAEDRSLRPANPNG